MSDAIRRCVIYARLSVTKEESVSIARQLESCRLHAQMRGWEIAGEFVDDGVSATANRPEDRPGWRSLLNASDYQAVIVWKIDRLARKVLDFLHVDEVLRERGAGLVAVEDPIDMTTPMGKAFATILAVFGEMEAAAIAARVKAAKKHLVEAGRWTGGGFPYGSMPIDNPDGDGKILVRDESRWWWLTELVRMAELDISLSQIARTFNNLEAPPPRQSRKRPYVWKRQAVYSILTNPAIAGLTPRNPGAGKGARTSERRFLMIDGEPVVNEPLAAMSIEQWKALRVKLDNVNHPAAKKACERVRTSPLMAKMVRCAECQVWLVRTHQKGGARLRCAECGQSVSRAHFDPWVVDKMLTERGHIAIGDLTVADLWQQAWADDLKGRAVLKSQIETLELKRTKTGAFDPERIVINWRQDA